MDDENKTPKDAQDFVAPIDTQNNDEGGNFQHPDAEKPPVTIEEMKKRAEVYKRKSEEVDDAKEKRWYQIKAEVELIVDGLGKGIDEGIKDGAAAFMALEFPTSASCDGHGVGGPWVDVYAPEPDGWQKSEEKKKEWTEANHIEKVKMEKLVQEFYENREVPDEVRLVLEPRGIFEAFRVQNNGNEDLIKVSKKEEWLQERVDKFKEEMDKFVEFLKEKYFNG